MKTVKAKSNCTFIKVNKCQFYICKFKLFIWKMALLYFLLHVSIIKAHTCLLYMYAGEDWPPVGSWTLGQVIIIITGIVAGESVNTCTCEIGSLNNYKCNLINYKQIGDNLRNTINFETYLYMQTYGTGQFSVSKR